MPRATGRLGSNERYVRSGRELFYFLLPFIWLGGYLVILEQAGADADINLVGAPLFLESIVRFYRVCVLTVRVRESWLEPIGDNEFGGRPLLTLIFWWLVFLSSSAIKVLMYLYLGSYYVAEQIDPPFPAIVTVIPLVPLLLVFPVYAAGHRKLAGVSRAGRGFLGLLFSLSVGVLAVATAVWWDPPSLSRLDVDPDVVADIGIIAGVVSMLIFGGTSYTLTWRWRASERFTVDAAIWRLVLSALIAALGAASSAQLYVRGGISLQGSFAGFLWLVALLVTLPFAKSQEEMVLKRVVLQDLKKGGNVAAAVEEGQTIDELGKSLYRQSYRSVHKDPATTPVPEKGMVVISFARMEP